jgi:hypothetical protein
MSRIVVLARKLDQGGAERQLVTLAKGLKRRGHDIQVVLFYSGGVYDAQGRGLSSAAITDCLLSSPMARGPTNSVAPRKTLASPFRRTLESSEINELNTGFRPCDRFFEVPSGTNTQ